MNDEKRYYREVCPFLREYCGCEYDSNGCNYIGESQCGLAKRHLEEKENATR